MDRVAGREVLVLGFRPEVVGTEFNMVKPLGGDGERREVLGSRDMR